MIEHIGRRCFGEFHINIDRMPLPGTNQFAVGAIFIALFIVGGNNGVKKFTRESHSSEFFNLAPAMLVNHPFAESFFIMPEQEG